MLQPQITPVGILVQAPSGWESFLCCTALLFRGHKLSPGEEQLSTASCETNGVMAVVVCGRSHSEAPSPYGAWSHEPRESPWDLGCVGASFFQQLAWPLPWTDIGIPRCFSMLLGLGLSTLLALHNKKDDGEAAGTVSSEGVGSQRRATCCSECGRWGALCDYHCHFSKGDSGLQQPKAGKPTWQVTSPAAAWAWECEWGLFTLRSFS